MTLKPLAGHAVVRRRLSLALARGALPQVILVSGPEGVGKQRLALWTAQLLFCEAPAASHVDASPTLGWLRRGGTKPGGANGETGRNGS